MTPLETIRKEIKVKRQEAIIHRNTMQMLFSILRMIIFLVIFVLIILHFISFKFVEGNGMFPSLCDSDLVMCFEKQEYQKNDIVFYTVNGEEYVGRVVAKGGDYIDYTESGNIIVNGTVQNGEIVFPTYKPEDWTETLVIPINYVYILGDYRTQTNDSRNFGCIALDDVECKVSTLLRHRKL